jgi:hypothetical protein
VPPLVAESERLEQLAAVGVRERDRHVPLDRDDERQREAVVAVVDVLIVKLGFGFRAQSE